MVVFPVFLWQPRPTNGGNSWLMSFVAVELSISGGGGNRNTVNARFIDNKVSSNYNSICESFSKSTKKTKES